MKFKTKKNIERATKMIVDKGYDLETANNMAINAFEQVRVDNFYHHVEYYIDQIQIRYVDTNYKIGFYTGIIYDDSVNVHTIKECCQIISYDDPVFYDENLFTERLIKLKQRCIGCNKCEKSYNI